MTFSLKIQTAKIFFALTYLFVLGCSDPAGESNNITSADINNQHLDMKDMGKKNTHDAPIHKPDLLQDTQTMDIKKDAHNDVSNDAEMKASLMPRLNITPQVLDEVMAIPVPTKAKEYSLWWEFLWKECANFSFFVAHYI